MTSKQREFQSYTPLKNLHIQHLLKIFGRRRNRKGLFI